MTQNTVTDTMIRSVKQRFGIVGMSPLLTAAIERAIKVAPIDLSVLVEGESGSGKEFFPQIIHYNGARKHRKYIAVNCGAIPEGTIDSELFGHEKGSFTGAISARKGYFEEANGGTIFLDEVAELPLTTQARLLRVLETGEYLKVGSSQVQKTDIRIVAATNVDLQQAIKDGKFRQDLYYRLSTVQIKVPNLHDRGNDIDLLARKFASDFSEHYMTAPITFADDTRKLMQAYRWPGNVRQLKNAVEQLALFHAGEEITPTRLDEVLPQSMHGECALTPSSRHKTVTYESERELLWQTIVALKAELNELRHSMQTSVTSTTNVPPEGLTRRAPLHPGATLIRWPESTVLTLTPEETEAPRTLTDSERDTIIAALARNAGSRKKTALELNISERTLYRKMKEYGITNTDK